MTGADPEPDLTLRPATRTDLPAVAEVFLAARAAAVPQMPPLADTVAQVHDQVTSWDLSAPDRWEVWVAEDDLGLVGYAVLACDWLDALYVAPDRQGEGAGGALLDLVRARRPRGFHLWVFAGNASARGFYRRHGLVELEHTDGSVNPERSAEVHMVCPGEEPLAFLRDAIDEVDAQLAELLARRFALVAAAQGHKEATGLGGGHAGRDAVREQEIVSRMAQRAPGLPAELIAPVMEVVIAESLSAWERERG